MKQLSNFNLILVTFVFSITGCSIMETKFEKSPYGKELLSMLHKCMESKEDGLLPGLGAGEDKSLEFTSDEIEFSQRNNVTYPLRLSCIVIDRDRKRTFFFTKQTPTSEWTLF